MTDCPVPGCDGEGVAHGIGYRCDTCEMVFAVDAAGVTMHGPASPP